MVFLVGMIVNLVAGEVVICVQLESEQLESEICR